MPTLEQRAQIRQRLLNEIERQINENDLHGLIEAVIEEDAGELVVGAKRNKTLERANGEYVVSIDDDDMICPTYLVDILEAMETKPDCITYEGVMTTDGNRPQKFVIKLGEKTFSTVSGVYYRYPHHIVPIRAELAKQVRFKDIASGEDSQWGRDLIPLLKTSVHIEKDMYFYEYVSKKPKHNRQRQTVVNQNYKQPKATLYYGENELHASKRLPTKIVKR
jgi:hypothetical protein